MKIDAFTERSLPSSLCIVYLILFNTGSQVVIRAATKGSKFGPSDA